MASREVLRDRVGRIGMDGICLAWMGSVSLEVLCADCVILPLVWFS